MKGQMHAGRRNITLRKGLTVVQFVLAIGLTASTVILWNQLDYMRDAKLGFDKENILLITPDEMIGPQYDALKHKLLQLPGVQKVTTAPFPGWTHVFLNSSKPEGAEDQYLMTYQVDYDFLETLNIPLAEGRNFDKNRPSDQEGAVLINESLALELGWAERLGRTRQGGVQCRVIGVVKDFHNATTKRRIDPIMIGLKQPSRLPSFGKVIVKMRGDDVSATLKRIEQTWRTFSPDHPFMYRFLDGEVDQFYKRDIRLGQLLNGFSFLTVIVACLGLIGLTAYLAEQRTREIGIRKVLGEGVFGIIYLFCKEYVLLVGIACALSAPTTYVIMQRWQDTFAYQVDIGWQPLTLVGLGTLVITLITVSYQFMTAAVANPVQSLHHE